MGRILGVGRRKARRVIRLGLLHDMANAHARNCAQEVLSGNHAKAGRFATMYAETVTEIEKLEGAATVSK